MKFYTKQHKFYCGIDLHTRKVYVCILNDKGKVKVHQNIPTKPEPLLELIAPFGEDQKMDIAAWPFNVHRVLFQYAQLKRFLKEIDMVHLFYWPKV